MTKDNQEVEGGKMIRVRVAFWTSGLPQDNGVSCYSSGTVYMFANERYGITSEHKANFNTIAEIGGKIEQLLADAGVTVVPSPGAKCYHTNAEVAA